MQPIHRNLLIIAWDRLNTRVWFGLVGSVCFVLFCSAVHVCTHLGLNLVGTVISPMVSVDGKVWVHKYALQISIEKFWMQNSLKIATSSETDCLEWDLPSFQWMELVFNSVCSFVHFILSDAAQFSLSQFVSG